MEERLLIGPAEKVFWRECVQDNHLIACKTA